MTTTLAPASSARRRSRRAPRRDRHEPRSQQCPSPATTSTTEAKTVFSRQVRDRPAADRRSASPGSPTTTSACASTRRVFPAPEAGQPAVHGRPRATGTTLIGFGADLARPGRLRPPLHPARPRPRRRGRHARLLPDRPALDLHLLRLHRRPRRASRSSTTSASTTCSSASASWPSASPSPPAGSDRPVRRPRRVLGTRRGGSSRRRRTAFCTAVDNPVENYTRVVLHRCVHSCGELARRTLTRSTACGATVDGGASRRCAAATASEHGEQRRTRPSRPAQAVRAGRAGRRRGPRRSAAPPRKPPRWPCQEMLRDRER